jgi:hypothetical protein
MSILRKFKKGSREDVLQSDFSLRMQSWDNGDAEECNAVRFIRGHREVKSKR